MQLNISPDSENYKTFINVLRNNYKQKKKNELCLYFHMQ